jgi:hypothetical protein
LLALGEGVGGLLNDGEWWVWLGLEALVIVIGPAESAERYDEGGVNVVQSTTYHTHRPSVHLGLRINQPTY